MPTTNPRPAAWKASRLALAVLAFAALTSAKAWGQIGALVSPGPLSRPHAGLEGIGNCQKCHEPGRQVTAARCLGCHKPIAERVAARKGVHRDAGDQCVACHAEHAGLDAELRPFDPARFDHAAETGFPLDGKHAPVARQCASCHKTRSFLTVRADCASCHPDPHKGSLGPTCTTCHTTAVRFADARARFDHSRTKFPLVGAHRTVDCARCHVNKTFTGVKFASCADCHRSPHRAPLGNDCASCHTNEAWPTKRIDHARTAFPLKGRHAAVPCATCHVRSAVRNPPKRDRCAACHVDVHQGQFKQDCGACHQESGFAKAPFDHARETRFALTGRHEALACGQCHKGASTRSPSRVGQAGRAVLFGGASSACVSCHADVHKGETSQSCETCHSTASFAVSAYAHASTPSGFFRGKHQVVPCASCHGVAEGTRVRLDVESGVPVKPVSAARPPIGTWRFKSVTTACATCHADVHAGQFGTACETCHAVEDAGFTASRFSHARTAFPLNGRHQAVDCGACHTPAGPGERGRTAPLVSTPRGTSAGATSGARRPARPVGPEGAAVAFRGTPRDCASCHRDVHLAQLGSRCETCHTSDTFKLATYTHQAPGLHGFFVGTHATLTCRACHKAEEGRFPAGPGTAVRYKGTGPACATCHAGEDVHRGALGSSCETCHEPARWMTVSRAFHKAGLFPLEGRHLSVPCASCHVGGVMKGTPTQCFDCHWARRQDDRYHTRLGTQCEQCHRPTSWTAVTWNHAARTGYPLNLAHQLLRCDNCHRNGAFSNTRLDCFGCHQAAFQATRSPSHVEAGFPTDCETCHRATASSWLGATFNHAAIFPLVGVHAAQACASCHRNNVFKGTPRDCVGCHQADYQRTQAPNHAAAGFPTACDTCHRPTDSSWHGATFNHAAVFPLVGVHGTQACASCHKNNVYKGTPRECVGCHQADYQRTQSPNHAAAGFPTTCETCHRASDSSWRGASFNHASVFPLVGVHATQACASCHKNNVYKGTPRECVGCHQSDYQQTQNPNHAAAGFPTDCQACHQASAPTWSASFNHNQFFPLLGRHQQQTCAACHRSGVYRGTPRECYPCHQSAYQQTRDPNHAAAGFPVTCETCHRASDSSWDAGRFNHTWFPITSGPHAGRTCRDCHPDTGNYRVFSCTTCHSRGETDSDHNGVNGYRYDSQACYACHPTGRD